MKHPREPEPEVDFVMMYAGYEFFDDVKGGSLDWDSVLAARRLEMDEF